MAARKVPAEAQLKLNLLLASAVLDMLQGYPHASRVDVVSTACNFIRYFDKHHLKGHHSMLCLTVQEACVSSFLSDTHRDALRLFVQVYIDVLSKTSFKQFCKAVTFLEELNETLTH